MNNFIKKVNLNNFSLPILLWLVFFLWRPWFLGFYYDDWAILSESIELGGPFSAERLDWYLWFSADRPMAGLNYWFFTSLLGNSPFLWQWLLILIFLLFMTIFFCFLKELFILLGLNPNHPSIGIATALWPCLPWLMGWSAWPCTTGFIFMTLFAFCGERLFHAWNRNRTPGPAPVISFGLLCLYYEQFYLQFGLFFLIAWLAGKARPLFSKKVMVPFASLMLFQSIILAWNRLSSPRAIQPYWPQLFMHSLAQLPSRLLKSVGSLKGLALVLFIALAILCAKAVRDWWRAHPDRNARIALMGTMGIAITGFLYCILFYALGGFEVWTLATSSRTAVGMSFWLVTLLALCVYCMITMNRSPRLALLQNTIMVLMIITLGISNFSRTLEWAKAWRLSTTIMGSLPQEDWQKLSPKAAVLYDGPFRYKEISFFGSPHALAGAMHYQYNILRRQADRGNTKDRFIQNGWTPFLLCSRAAINWDGQTLRQIVNKQNMDFSARELWIWQVKARRLVKLTPPVQNFRCAYQSGSDFKFDSRS